MTHAHAPSHENEYRDLDKLLADGGKAVIIGGRHKNWKEYRDHPQLEFWSGDQDHDVMRSIRSHNNTLPANTKIAIVSKFIPHTASEIVVRSARVRGVKIFQNRTDGQISELLDILTLNLPKERSKVTEPAPTGPKPVVKIETSIPSQRPLHKGELMKFVRSFDDGTGKIIEVGRRVFAELTRQGIRTTESSCAQAVGAHRKKMAKNWVTGYDKPVETPQPAILERERDPIIVARPVVKHDILELFDDAIANLKSAVAGFELAREALTNAAAENIAMRERLAAVQKLLGGEIGRAHV